MPTFTTNIKGIWGTNATFSTNITFNKTEIDGNVYKGNLSFISRALSSSGRLANSFTQAVASYRLQVSFYTLEGDLISTITAIDWYNFYKAKNDQASLWANNKCYNFNTNPSVYNNSSNVSTLRAIGNYNSMVSTGNSLGYSAVAGVFVGTEPYGIRYNSDVAGTIVFQPRKRSTHTTWYFSAVSQSRSGSPVPKDFSFTIPDNAGYFKCTFQFKNAGYTYSYTFPEGSGVPSDATFLLETNSKIQYKSSSDWTNSGRVWLKTSSDWEKKDAYRKDASDWTKL